MSSIDSSNSSQRNDSVRRAREEYKQRESDLVKKHHKELKRLNEQHYSEIEKVKDIYEDKVGGLKKQAREAITARDHKYQKEMDQLRNLHRKQVQQVAGEADGNVKNTRKVLGREMAQLRDSHEDQVARLREHYQSLIERKDETFGNSLEEMRQTQRKSIDKIRTNLSEKHEERIDNLLEGRRREVADLQSNYRSYRKNAEGRLKDQEVRHLQSKQNMSNTFMDQLKGERQVHSDVTDDLRQGLQDGLSQTREKYRKAYQEDQEVRRDAFGSLKEDVHGRMDDQVERLEKEVSHLKGANILERNKLEREKNRELSNYRDAFQKQVDIHKDTKEEALRQANVRNSKEMKEVHAEASDLMKDNTRFYLQTMETQNFKNREAFDSMTNMYESRQRQVQQQADRRVETVVKETQETEKKLNNMHQESLEAIRDRNADEMRKMRLGMLEERRKIIGNLKEQMRQEEIKHGQDVERMTSKYEKEIKNLKLEIVNNKRQADKNLQRTIENLKQAHHAESLTQKSQYEEKLNQLERLHKEQLQSNNQRHQKQVDELVSTMRKT